MIKILNKKVLNNLKKAQQKNSDPFFSHAFYPIKFLIVLFIFVKFCERFPFLYWYISVSLIFFVKDDPKSRDFSGVWLVLRLEAGQWKVSNHCIHVHVTRAITCFDLPCLSQRVWLFANLLSFGFCSWNLNRFKLLSFSGILFFIVTIESIQMVKFFI